MLVSNNSSGIRGSSKSGSSSSNRKSSGTASGYRADREQNSCRNAKQPPDYINLRDKFKDEETHESSGLSAKEQRAKRRKISAAVYDATRVREDLTQAGLPYPKARTDIPCRALRSFSGVNMGAVELVIASSVDKASRKDPETEKNAFIDFRHRCDTVASLIGECQSFYWISSKPAPLGQREESDWESSTSSVTDSDDANPSFSTRLEEESCSDAEREPLQPTVTMGEALEMSKEPRYVLEDVLLTRVFCRLLLDSRRFIYLIASQGCCSGFLAIRHRPYEQCFHQVHWIGI